MQQQIVSEPARVLRQEEGLSYLNQGYIVKECVIGYTAVSYPTSNCKKVVCREEARFARLEPMQMRPYWSDEYTSTFEHQEEA